MYTPTCDIDHKDWIDIFCPPPPNETCAERECPCKLIYEQSDKQNAKYGKIRALYSTDITVFILSSSSGAVVKELST